MRAVIRYAPDVLFLDTRYDEVEASCQAFEMTARLVCEDLYPGLTLEITRDDAVKTLGVQTFDANDVKGHLSAREAIWSRLHDVIGPYAGYRRRRNLRHSVPVGGLPAAPPAREYVLVEDDYGPQYVLVTEEEKMELLKSGFATQH